MINFERLVERTEDARRRLYFGQKSDFWNTLMVSIGTLIDTVLSNDCKEILAIELD